MRSSERLAGIQNNRSLVAYGIGRPGIIFGGTGKQIGEVEKAVWHPGVNVEFQDFRAVPGPTATTDKTFKAAVTGGSSVNPRSSSSFSPTIYTDTRRKSSRKNSRRDATLRLGLLPPQGARKRCSRSMQDTGGWSCWLGVGKALEAWYDEGDNVEKRYTCLLYTSPSPRDRG